MQAKLTPWWQRNKGYVYLVLIVLVALSLMYLLFSARQYRAPARAPASSSAGTPRPNWKEVPLPH
jgi:hypothetical protein